MSFEEHAAPEAVAAVLREEMERRARLDARIAHLEQLLARRTAEKEAGLWPPRFAADTEREKG